jgi:hypothetical protein
LTTTRNESEKIVGWGEKNADRTFEPADLTMIQSANSQREFSSARILRVLATTSLVGSFVVAGLAAGLAVHEAVVANANVNQRLAEAAEFFALARVFRLLALRATVFGGAGSGTHVHNLSPLFHERNIT